MLALLDARGGVHHDHHAYLPHRYLPPGAIGRVSAGMREPSKRTWLGAVVCQRHSTMRLLASGRGHASGLWARLSHLGAAACLLAANLSVST